MFCARLHSTVASPWSLPQLASDAWLDSLPGSLQDTATAEASRAICDLDLTELHAIEPPRGFGRD
jgi:hypothetical protein